MSALPHMVISRLVPEFFALGSVLLPDTDNVLSSSLATWIVAASDGTEATIFYGDGCWRLRITPELREQARVMLLSEHRHWLEAYVRDEVTP